jgi:hypothetical protein
MVRVEVERVGRVVVRWSVWVSSMAEKLGHVASHGLNEFGEMPAIRRQA